MDASKFSSIIIFVGIFLCLCLAQVKAESEFTIVTDDSEKTCTSKISDCSTTPPIHDLLLGLKGAMGEQGLPGVNRKCDCIPRGNTENDKGESRSRPSKRTCRNVSQSDQKQQWLGKNELDSFKIECVEGNLTCIARENFLPAVFIEINKNLTGESQFVYWNKIASRSLKDMLGIRSSQITWLHGLVNSARQTLRIHGLNVAAQNRGTIGTFVQLLTWNDVIIGSASTDSAPFYYNVVFPDSCTETNSTAKPCEYFDVTMETEMVVRLPVTDIIFNFSSTEANLNVSVENIELCFE
ncbi:uncharacterized protein LOC114247928 [Bombyx mandarina]|uniref:Uncharacterized protein LOC114247928 n=1 Tax=Bombyx mandarina TaxID=7092 RepID=A0A6J2K937_BOMMA|nr:uncharacterized protein LOC114247928 [Bombyx mandarina]